MERAAQFPAAALVHCPDEQIPITVYHGLNSLSKAFLLTCWLPASWTSTLVFSRSNLVQARCNSFDSLTSSFNRFAVIGRFCRI